MRARLLVGDGTVDVSRGFAPDNNKGDADDELRWRGWAARTAELKAQIAVGDVVGFFARAVEVGRIHRHRKQQRRYRKEGNELACT
jgi:hypothetical protein